MTKATSKLSIVLEVIEIIEHYKEEDMTMLIPMQVSRYLCDVYGYDKGDALTLLEGVYLIQELELM